MDKVQLGKYYQMGPKSFWLLLAERISPVLFLIILAFTLPFLQGNDVFIQFSQIFSSLALVLFIATVIFFVISIAVSLLEYNTNRVMMDESSFHIVRGILSKKETSLPYRRIQRVVIKQSLLYRLLGVGHVVISTTTDLDQPTSDRDDESDDEVIRSMDYPLARLLEKTLTDRAETERMEVRNK